jgi:hypothetical protein
MTSCLNESLMDETVKEKLKETHFATGPSFYIKTNGTDDLADG